MHCTKVKADYNGFEESLNRWFSLTGMFTGFPQIRYNQHFLCQIKTLKVSNLSARGLEIQLPPGLRNHFTMAHNDYLHFVSELGLMLIPILIWMIIALFRHGFMKLGNLSRLVRGTTLGAMSGIFAILVHSMVDFNLHIPANAILFTALTAVVAAPVPRIRKRHGEKGEAD